MGESDKLRPPQYKEEKKNKGGIEEVVEGKEKEYDTCHFQRASTLVSCASIPFFNHRYFYLNAIYKIQVSLSIHGKMRFGYDSFLVLNSAILIHGR